MTGITVNDQMTWAEGQVGFVEGNNNSNPYGPWQGVWNAAYCDSFAQMAAVQQGGFEWPTYCQFGFRGDAYCPYTEAHARKLGIWHDKGDGYEPRRGDQRLYDWTGWGGADHIETFWGRENGKPWNIGANTGSPGGVRYCQRDETYLRGTVAWSDLPPDVAPVPNGPRELRKGFSGEDVLWLQRRLLDLGYDVPGGADGDFGSGTEQAVFNFQHDWSPPVDGIVGLVTREDLANDAHRADMHNPPPEPSPDFPQWAGVYLKRGDRGDEVWAFQSRLKTRGWSIVVDGWFGRDTLRVVKAFQSNMGLVIDGIVGRETWDAMWTEPIS